MMEQINLWKLKSGTKIKVKTQNHGYCLEILDTQDLIKIQGGKYFSEPQIVFFRGSTRGGIIRVGRIEINHAMEFICEDGKMVSTSNVKEIELNGS